MNMRSMDGPRRCDTRWPQTQVMRRIRRRVRYERPDWDHLAELLVLLLCTLAAGYAWFVKLSVGA